MTLAIDLQEWQKATPATHKQLRGLLLPEDEATEQLMQALTTSGRLAIRELRQGLSLETTSYVGRIMLGQVQITIRPKIRLLPLLRLMQYAYGLRQLHLFPTTSFESERLSFQDLLISQLLAEANELLLRGLHRQYVPKTEALASPRGRINFQHIVNQGGVVTASLPCTHTLRVEDCLVNQVLLQGIRTASHLTNDEQLTLQLHHLERSFHPGISTIPLTPHTFDRLRRESNRLTAAYQPALTLIELLSRGRGISLSDKQEEPIPSLRLPGFLFNMNSFFQELLSRFLREHLPEYDLVDQYEFTGMISYIDNPRKRKAPKPRPDYVVKHRGKIRAILDAKYRDLWQEALPASMLYQLVMYAIGQDACEQVTILYPTTRPEAQDARIEVRLPAHQQSHIFVLLRPVNLLHLDILLNKTEQPGIMNARGIA